MNSEEHFMQRCIDLAYLGLGRVAPNPMVGCVIVKDGEILGEGYHRAFGEPHAEIEAIKNVGDNAKIKGATVYVSLEPCTHFGKTPPCVSSLIELKPRKVVIGSRDSNPTVAGKGIDRLQREGIEVVEGVLEEECRELNKRFFTFHEKRRPYVILKWAQTQDGYLDRNREEDETGINWISTVETKMLVHQWRAEESGILVGRNTILNDNPSLTVRQVSGKNPTRIVIDSNLQLSSDVGVFSDEAPTLVFNRVKSAQKENVEWIKIPETSTQHILEELYRRNILSVLVEGGSRTLQYFIIDNVWDEARVIVSPIKFKEGMRAPVLTKTPIRSHPFGPSDTVYYYQRK
ncbi:MAG: bifunctional diaminohydroxyphosphoribosylaminopyrimidine deaminase/5-amino-6-(5-phosphoribosylamino)uracil reductase RibD [Bacteroidota bacterium]